METNTLSEERIVIIEETESHYLGKTDDGKMLKLVKINTEEIKKKYESSILKVAKALDKEHIVDIISILEDMINNVPTVEEYQHKAILLSAKLESLYRVVGNHNLFHHPIKTISLDIYGKAQHFMKEIKKLHKDMLSVADSMMKLGKLKDVKTKINEAKKITIITIDDQKLISMKRVPKWFQTNISLYNTKII